MQTRSFRISNKTTIHISASDKQSDLNKPLYAINWFNIKSKKLYNLYGALVFSHVKKVGGEVVFKGKVSETLSGNDKLKRESLLIVKYPNADGFLGLFAQKMFLVKSLLRIKAVKDFVFGFTKMTAGSAVATQKPKRYIGDNCYMIHVIKGEKYELNKNVNEETSAGINLFFDGQKIAYIGRSADGDKVKNGPFFIERILIWEADQVKTLEKWIDSNVYPIQKRDIDSEGFYIVKRLL